MTGSDGRFVFRRLPGGRYDITAVKPGYLEGQYGRRRPAGAAQTLSLVDGQKVGGIRVYLWRHASISGAVIDEAGEPVVGVQVRAFLRRVMSGRRRFAPDGALGWTDDRGFYRIHGLQPGDYIVAATATQVSAAVSAAQDVRQGAINTALVEDVTAATASGANAIQVGDAVLALGRSAIGPAPSTDGRVFVYPTTFHPNTPNPQRAAVLAVGPGEERGGVDLHLRPVATRRVSGTLTSADGTVGGLAVRLLSEDADDTPLDFEVATTVTGRNGTFVMPAVPVGLYSIRAVRGVMVAGGSLPAATVINTASGATLSVAETFDSRLYVNYSGVRWTSAPVAVGRDDVDGVNLSLQPGLRISGRVEFEGAGARPLSRLAQVPVLIEPSGTTARMAPIPGRFDSAGQFNASGFPGGKYMIRVGAAPAGWTLKSVTFNGVDVLDTPIDLEAGDATGVVFTFTDRPTELTGAVTNATGTSNLDATVLVFPSDVQTWTSAWVDARRFRSVRVEPTGAFRILALPPGEYHVAAIPDELSRDWQDPAFLDALSRAGSQVTLVEGESRTLNLRIREVRQ
jgi:hypothetical protein